MYKGGVSETKSGKEMPTLSLSNDSMIIDCNDITNNNTIEIWSPISQSQAVITVGAFDVNNSFKNIRKNLVLKLNS